MVQKLGIKVFDILQLFVRFFLQLLEAILLIAHPGSHCFHPTVQASSVQGKAAAKLIETRNERTAAGEVNKIERDLGKCTHQCDETQGNNSAQELSTKIVFVGRKKRDR